MKDTVFVRAGGATFASLRVTIPCLNGGKFELWNVKKVACY